VLDAVIAEAIQVVFAEYVDKHGLDEISEISRQRLSPSCDEMIECKRLKSLSGMVAMGSIAVAVAHANRTFKTINLESMIPLLVRLAVNDRIIPQPPIARIVKVIRVDDLLTISLSSSSSGRKRSLAC